MTRTPAPSRLSLVGLLVLDALLAWAVFRLPSRVVQIAPPPGLARAAASWSALVSNRALFLVNTAAGPALSVVPLDARGPQPAALVALPRPATGEPFAAPQLGPPLEAGLATAAAPRWAWNGRTLAVLSRPAPSATPGAPRLALLLFDPARARFAAPWVLEGARPSVGWARDAFEVAFLAPAAPGAPNAQWLARVTPDGVLSSPPTIIAPAGATHPTLYWPGGARALLDSAPAHDYLLADGTAAPVPPRDGAELHTFFRLEADGRVRPAPARVTIAAGSVSLGDYAARIDIGDVTVRAHLGARNARPRYEVSRGAARGVFETENEARPDELLVAESAGALHLLDAHGFHVVLSSADLHPIGPRENRLSWLAGALGDGVLGLVFAALMLAHLLALLIERAAREPSEALNRYARFASSSLLVLAAGALLVVWSAGAGLALP